MERTLLQLNAVAEGTPRVETLMGREFSVFPAVLVRSQVLNNNLGATFLPGSEIEASTDAWNGIPVVIRHPEDLRSARDPEVLNETGVGFLFRARFEDDALKADVFVDLARAGDVEDASSVVNSVESGQVGEVSTGFGLNIERTPGEHAGEPYDVVMRDIQPDHLALLVDETGACSVEDGCGLGVNEQRTFRERVVAFLRSKLGLFPDALNQSDEDLRELLASTLRERFGDTNTWIWPVAVFSGEGLVVYERESRGGDDGLFRVSFEVSESNEVTLGEPEEVHRVTTFEPVANAGDPHQEVQMERSEMIAQLEEAGTDRAALDALSDCQLKALLAAGETTADGHAAAADELLAELTAKVEAQDAKIEQLEGAAQPAIEAQERERTELVERLVGNERVKVAGYTEDSLKTKSVAELKQIATLVRVESYAGRGGPRSNSQNTDEAFAPVRPYWLKED